MFVTYNSITFAISQTRDLSFDAVYDDSGIDYLYTRVRIDVQGVVNPDAFSNPTGALPATTIANVKAALMTPRQRLVISDYGHQTLLDVTLDAKGGPFPRNARVTEVFGSKTFLIHWSCEAFINECDYTLGPVLSNRWQDEHHVKEDFLTTRVAWGRTAFRADALVDLGRVPDEYLALILPVVPPGFQRTHVDQAATPDGLNIMWRVTDEERMYDIGETGVCQGGPGIVRIDGHHGVTSFSTEGGPPGGMTLANISLKATGTKQADQWVMLQRLFSLSVGILGIGDPTRGFVVHAALDRSLGPSEKWAQLDLTFQQFHKTTQQVSALPNIDTMKLSIESIFPSTGGINPNLPSKGGAAGTATVQLLTQSLTGPCSVPGVTAPGGWGGCEPGTTLGPPPVVSVGSVDQLPAFPNLYQSTGSTTPYTRYHITRRVKYKSGVYMMPISGKPSSPTPTAGPGGHWNPSTGIWERDYPTGSGGGTGAGSGANGMIRVHEPMGIATTEVEAERINAPPVMPKPAVNSANQILRDVEIAPAAPVLAPDGENVIYRTWMKIKHWFRGGAFLPLLPSGQGPEFFGGKIPYINSTYIDPNAITPDIFAEGIIDT